MTKFILGLLAAGAILAAFPGFSYGDIDEAPPPGGPLPTTDPLHLPMVESLEPVAEAYWVLRGIELPQPVEVFLLPPEEFEGRGEMPGHRVWLSEKLLDRRGWDARATLCLTYLHERGHNAGLAHGSGDPVMDVGPALEAYEHRVPPKCLHWADEGYKAALRH